VHSSLEPCEDVDFTFTVNFNSEEHIVYVRCRPHLKDFLERVSGLFEIIIFTASQSIYAEQLLNVLDPKRKIFRHRVFRESCVYVEGNYLKDLTVLGRDLAHVIIIDNSPQVTCCYTHYGVIYFCFEVVITLIMADICNMLPLLLHLEPPSPSPK
jgi:CTD small phosphatase-like protein 2